MKRLKHSLVAVTIGCGFLGISLGSTAQAAGPDRKFSDDLYLTLVGSVRNSSGEEVPFCSVASRDQTERFTLFGTQPNANGYAIASANISPELKQNSVVIQKGNEQGKVEFNVSSLPVAKPAPDASPEAVVRLLAPNSDVKDVVSIYAALSGCRVITDATLAGPITVNLDPAATKEQALDAIERTLILNGFGVVDAGENLLAVTGIGKNPRPQAPIYQGVEQLPKRERIATCIVRLKHRKPSEIQQQLMAFIVPRASGYTQCLSDEASGALLITESTSVIRNLGTLIETLDAPPQPSTPTP